VTAPWSLYLAYKARRRRRRRRRREKLSQKPGS